MRAWLTMAVGLFICLSFLAYTGLTSAQEKRFLADRHGDKGMACDACHKESPPKDKVPMAVCVKCHGNYEKLAEKTKELEPNPHLSHEADLPCDSCHRGHKAPVNYCLQCHATFTFPLK